MTLGGKQAKGSDGHRGQEPSSDRERQGMEEAGGAGAVEGPPGPSAAVMSLSPWPIPVPRGGVVQSGIHVPKQPARPSWQGAGRRAAELRASQVAYSLSKAGLLNLQASL